MKTFFIMAFLAVTQLSCAKKELEVKHVSTETPTENLKNIKVVNVEDPVCKMPTADFLKFTSDYKGKKYGFCSLACKTKFEKNPEKYLR
ncbi:YHS domain-containing protein [Halpernia frigidisoli]|uniref:YHS domain-containing protein n=1 Tax=Halpernia frigidisoli TaxID=1125876 RepID=A0A1I3J5E4_9FLAO|nr:YHS domain-containing protein [Halpernia frigidisoli]SFI55502.1 YHS domain-containing protein [Halpernia frigidisoli]